MFSAIAEILRREGRTEVLTQEIFDAVTPQLKVGLTEKDVATIINGEMEQRGLGPAWEPTHCPAVFTGPDSAGAHAGPTNRAAEPGHVLNIDFGVRKGGYCSDLQRTWYFLRPGETEAPEAVQRGFSSVVSFSRASQRVPAVPPRGRRAKLRTQPLRGPT